MKENKLEIEVIKVKVLKKSVRIKQAVWNVDQIYECLKRIEKEKGFKGFTSIHFDAGDYPVINYILDFENK